MFDWKGFQFAQLDKKMDFLSPSTEQNTRLFSLPSLFLAMTFTKTCSSEDWDGHQPKVNV